MSASERDLERWKAIAVEAAEAAGRVLMEHAGAAVADAARREAKEETCLDVTLTEQLFTYSAPDRDPRGHTCSVVFTATATGTPRAADDAKNLAVFALTALPPLAFDHRRILDDYLEYKRSGRRPPVDR